MGGTVVASETLSVLASETLSEALSEAPADVLRRAQGHLDALRQLLGEVEIEAMDADLADAWLELACATERLGAGAKLWLVPATLRRGGWKDEGYRSEAAWWADRTRTTVPDAVGQLRTAKRLACLPATADAVRAGTLSSVEARGIAAAAEAHPDSEQELLGAAGSVRSSDLLHTARAVAQAAKSGVPGHRESLRARRFVRFWTDEEGMVRMSAGFTPDEGARLFSAVRSRAAYVADEARQAGTAVEDQVAYDADALVALAVGDDRRATFDGTVGVGRCRPRVFLHVDLAALSRGALEPGDLCEIAGFGPVPLSVARTWLGDSELSVVFREGVDISRVNNLGRTISAATEAALVARDRCCVVPGCHVSVGLENDHWLVPFCEGGASELWNLARICVFHHRLKTYEGYRLAGGPGGWEWIPPVGAPPARDGPRPVPRRGKLWPCHRHPLVPRPIRSVPARPWSSRTAHASATLGRAGGLGLCPTAPTAAAPIRRPPISAWRSPPSSRPSRRSRVRCLSRATRHTS